MYDVSSKVLDIKGLHENVSPFAIISPSSKLGDNVSVGPFSQIGENVSIGDNTIIGSHVVLTGNTIIGKNNEIYHGAIVGEKPQDLKYAGEDSYLIIGDNNIIREYVTIHKGTNLSGGETVIGNFNHIMSNVHIAHDVRIGNYNIIAQSAIVGGHVSIEDHVVIGGITGIHQFVNIGQNSMIGGHSKITQDVLPFSLVDGNPAKFFGLNVIGLRRKLFSNEERLLIKKAFKFIKKLKSDSVGCDFYQINIDSYADNKFFMKIFEFIKKSKRGFYY